ncbi:hypothetical protein QJQ45_025058, partial [Haematococcus lacustris]
ASTGSEAPCPPASSPSGATRLGSGPLAPPLPPSPAPARPTSPWGAPQPPNHSIHPPTAAQEAKTSPWQGPGQNQPPEAVGAVRAVGAVGAVHQPPLPPPEVLTPLAIAGGPLTRADACLHLANLPPKLGPEALAALCQEWDVVSVHLGPGLHLARGQAFLVFGSVKEAALCAEALAGRSPWGGSRQLGVQFSPGLPLDSPARSNPGGVARPASSWVWCAGGLGEAGGGRGLGSWRGRRGDRAEGQGRGMGLRGGAASGVRGQLSPDVIVTALREAGMPMPKGLLRVQAGMP